MGEPLAQSTGANLDDALELGPVDAAALLPGAERRKVLAYAGVLLLLQNFAAPNGGLIGEGYIHGMNLITEAVRQVRGTAANQVVGAETAVFCSGRSAVVLGAW